MPEIKDVVSRVNEAFANKLENTLPEEDSTQLLAMLSAAKLPKATELVAFYQSQTKGTCA